MRLATFNILHGRSPRDGAVDLGRFAGAVRALDADVLALQEVDRNQPRSHRADLTALAAEAMDARWWRFFPTLAGTPGRLTSPPGAAPTSRPEYGIALLSRRPVRSWEVLALPALGGTVALPRTSGRHEVLLGDEPRVAVVAVVEDRDGPVTVVATHLSFVPGWNVRQLRHLVRRLRHAPRPVVLLGDLNLAGRRPARLTGWQPLAAAATYPAHRPRRQLDHILVDGAAPSVREAVAVDTGLSDHRALVVGSDLRPGAPAPG